MNTSIMLSDIKTDEDYLSHFGILGMRWGIRRYQNKDGTLTNAGKKRYSKLKAEMEKLSPSENRVKEEDRSGDTISYNTRVKKDPRSMGDKELKAANNRMQDEIKYFQNTEQLSSYYKSKGGKFIKDTSKAIYNKTVNDVIANQYSKRANSFIDTIISKMAENKNK